MKKIFNMIFLMMLSATVVAQSNQVQNSVKDTSTTLAQINQEIVNVYQKEEEQPLSNVRVQPGNTSIQITIPVTSFQNASATLNHQVKAKVKSPSKKQTEDIYEIVINKMRALKKQYENNPYIRISGFDINIGIVPSVTVSIEFKE